MYCPVFFAAIFLSRNNFPKTEISHSSNKTREVASISQEINTCVGVTIVGKVDPRIRTRRKLKIQ